MTETGTLVADMREEIMSYMRLSSINISWDGRKTISRNSTEYLNIPSSTIVYARYSVNNSPYSNWEEITARMLIDLGGMAGYKNVDVEIRSAGLGEPEEGIHYEDVVNKNIGIWKL